MSKGTLNVYRSLREGWCYEYADVNDRIVATGRGYATEELARLRAQEAQAEYEAGRPHEAASGEPAIFRHWEGIEWVDFRLGRAGSTRYLGSLVVDPRYRAVLAVTCEVRGPKEAREQALHQTCWRFVWAQLTLPFAPCSAVFPSPTGSEQEHEHLLARLATEREVAWGYTSCWSYPVGIPADTLTGVEVEVGEGVLSAEVNLRIGFHCSYRAEVRL